MNLKEMYQEVYFVVDRVKERAELADRTLDAHDMERVEALLTKIERDTRQHLSNCQ